jgi:hypothetical protein
MTAAIEERIARLVAAISNDQLSISVLSTGERIAVALVLDRDDLFPHDIRSILEAVDRLGPDWTRAALAVQRKR